MRPFMHHQMFDRVGGYFWLFTLGRLFVFALIVLGIVLLVRALSHRHPGVAPTAQHPAGTSSAQQILEERFARGEIDEDEFRKRRDALRG